MKAATKKITEMLMDNEDGANDLPDKAIAKSITKEVKKENEAAKAGSSTALTKAAKDKIAPASEINALDK